jgi:hypothetical protein
MEVFFTKVYETKLWGDNQNTEYNGSSGDGSNVDYNKDTYVPFLKQFIRENRIQTIVDLGCGDFKCGKLIYDDADVRYRGYDTYQKIVDYNAKQHSLPKYGFEHLDFFNCREDIVNGDLCILKDVLQHWHLDEIYTFLDYLVTSKKFKYILICNCCHQTTDNPENADRFTPLSVQFFPLKKYNPIKLYNYHTKEISVIEIR